MSHSQIVIHVRDGTIEDVYLDGECTQVLVVNFDTAGDLPRHPSTAYVQPLSPQPLRELAGSDIEAAIDAAIEQDVLSEPAWEGAALPC